LPGSPAINAGANPWTLATDQRGFPRVVGAAADIGAFEVQTPPVVQSVVVNDGAAQRSEVRRLTVRFSGPVAFAGGDGNAAAAFKLTGTGPTGATGNVTLAATVTTVVQGRTVVSLTFSGPFTEANTSAGASPSLIDGVYTLTINSDSVTGAGRLALDGDANSTPGGDCTLSTHRLFGDGDGDLLDLGPLIGSLFGVRGQAGPPVYNPAFDFAADGDVDLLDLGQFVQRLFTSGYTP
jgi:hypothetical protein